jgi:hypothetical protein
VPTFTTRIPDEEDLLRALETVGDTPVLGLYRDDKLIALSLTYHKFDEDTPGIVRTLNEAIQHSAGEGAP